MTAVAATQGASPFRRILSGIDWIAALLVILAMAGMVAIVSIQVILRYALNSSLDWAEEVSRLLFVWSIFLAVPLGVKRGSHVGLSLLTSLLPPGLRTGLYRVVNAGALALMAVVAWEAALLTAEQWDELMTTLDVSVGAFMLPVVIGAVHSILHLLDAFIHGEPVKTAAVVE
jgi:TRAP-type C4-dicarboxylate transport system permease small subunit